MSSASSLGLASRSSIVIGGMLLRWLRRSAALSVSAGWPRSDGIGRRSAPRPTGRRSDAKHTPSRWRRGTRPGTVAGRAWDQSRGDRARRWWQPYARVVRPACTGASTHWPSTNDLEVGLVLCYDRLQHLV